MSTQKFQNALERGRLVFVAAMSTDSLRCVGTPQGEQAWPATSTCCDRMSVCTEDMSHWPSSFGLLPTRKQLLSDDHLNGHHILLTADLAIQEFETNCHAIRISLAGTKHAGR